MVSSLEAPALARVVRAYSVAGSSSVVVLVSAIRGAGPTSSASDAMVGRSSTSLLCAFSTLSLTRAIVISAGLLPAGTNGAGAPDIAILSRQLGVARRQRDTVRQELASVRLIEPVTRNDELGSSLASSSQ